MDICSFFLCRRSIPCQKASDFFLGGFELIFMIRILLLSYEEVIFISITSIIRGFINCIFMILGGLLESSAMVGWK